MVANKVVGKVSPNLREWLTYGCGSGIAGFCVEIGHFLGHTEYRRLPLKTSKSDLVPVTSLCSASGSRSCRGRFWWGSRSLDTMNAGPSGFRKSLTLDFCHSPHYSLWVCLSACVFVPELCDIMLFLGSITSQKGNTTGEVESLFVLKFILLAIRALYLCDILWYGCNWHLWR